MQGLICHALRCGVQKTETFMMRIARQLSSIPEDKVFSRMYDDKGQVASVRTFHGMWAASGEVRSDQIAEYRC